MRRERNQVAVGAIFLVVLLTGVCAAFFAEDLPIIGGGTRYTAVFAESAGLKPDDEVRIAGVKAGEVSEVSLRGDRVEVGFRVDDAWVGDRSSVSIEIKTLLGEKYVALQPEGDREQDPDRTIGRDRTRSPFDVTDALQQLTRTADRLDTGQLARSFEVISETFKNTPPHLRGALNGLSELSKTISSRDAELARLLSDADRISGVAADRSAQVQQLFADGNLLLGELQFRKNAVDRLLAGTEDLATQLRGVVADNEQQLRPALAQLQGVTELLRRNQDNISRGLREMAPFIRVFNNTISNGRWFDGYLCGLIPPTSLGVGVGLNQEGCPPPDPGTGGGG